MTMPAITIWQPWASLIACEAKPYETRGYPPPAKYVGKRIAIHAAVRDPNELYMTMYRDSGTAWERICNALDDAGFDGLNWSSLPLGAVVCTAVLAGAYQCGRPQGPEHVGVADVAGDPDILKAISFRTDRFGDYSAGRWAWLLTDVKPLDPPVAAKGKQRWWRWEYPREGAADG